MFEIRGCERPVKDLHPGFWKRRCCLLSVIEDLAGQGQRTGSADMISNVGYWDLDIAV